MASSSTHQREQQQDPLVFATMGIGKELSLLLGSYYCFCEGTFGEELRQQQQQRAETSSARGCGADEDNAAEPVPQQQQLITPLPMVRATAQFLEGAEGLSAPSAVATVATKAGGSLGFIIRRDANGLPILEL